MTQKRRSSRGASRQGSDSQPGGALRWYGAGLLSGLFLAFLLYLVTLPPEGGEPPIPEPVATGAGKSPTLQYEFYEVLPSQDITVDVDPAEIPPPRNRSAVSDKQFLLQAGSFRDKDDADRHRAELLLLGLSPRIEETRGDTGRWFRVVLGPFANRSSMAKARSLTAQQDIDTLLVQRKIN